MCIHTDSARALLGRCGDDEAAVVIPSRVEGRRPCVDAGRVGDWDVLRATWTKGIAYLQVGFDAVSLNLL